MSFKRPVFTILPVNQGNMKPLIFFFMVLLVSCQQKQREESPAQVEADSVTQEDMYEGPEQTFDYSQFYGIFDHESSTKGFSAVLVLEQNGNDLYFHATVTSQLCNGEMEGVVMMEGQAEEFPLGFFDSEDCKLQFTFSPAEKKVDIKEVAICRSLGPNCSFEGTFVRRKD